MAYEVTKDYRNGPRANETVPARNGEVVVPAGADLARYYRSLYCNAGGTVTGIMLADETASGAGTSISWTVVAGQVLDVAFRRISVAPANTIGYF